MKKSKIIALGSCGVPVALVAAFFIFTGVRSSQFKKLDAAEPVAFEINAEQKDLLTSLPYTLPELGIQVGAESAILIDVSNGNIIYQKNADKVIPSASMTKLFAMYVVEQEVSAGHLRYDDIIPLPPECWACNMPPHSSLMFLGKGQIVTLEELLLGLSICSGNDAA